MTIEIDGETEEEFLAAYEPRKYPPMAVNAEVALFTLRDQELFLLLIERRGHPHRGRYALPSWFMQPHESIEATARRALAEETSLALDPRHLEQLKTYSTPGRDPRDCKVRVTSVAHLAFMPDPGEPEPGTHARSAAFVPVDDLAGVTEGGTIELAFDHATIISDALERLAAKLEYTTVAAAFLPEQFTLAELRGIYESVWGTSLDPGNFTRKVTGVDGFVASVPARRKTGGRSAQLFTHGGAQWMLPPMLRPASTGSRRAATKR
ncbi:MAG: NUDIX hydrolase [Acidimicrobiia bacterium]|nr:NUDIX hydrolase [Acidimicrobiia bacterium]